jgi:hypothetical protein
MFCAGPESGTLVPLTTKQHSFAIVNKISKHIGIISLNHNYINTCKSAKDLSMHCRGFVSQTSTHLLPQALRFRQSNEQPCKCSVYQIHHAILSSVKMTTYPLARLVQVQQERLLLRQPKSKYDCLKDKSNMQEQASTCSKQTGLPFRGTGFGQPTNDESVTSSN